MIAAQLFEYGFDILFKIRPLIKYLRINTLNPDVLVILYYVFHRTTTATTLFSIIFFSSIQPELPVPLKNYFHL